MLHILGFFLLISNACWGHVGGTIFFLIFCQQFENDLKLTFTTIQCEKPVHKNKSPPSEKISPYCAISDVGIKEPRAHELYNFHYFQWQTLGSPIKSINRQSCLLMWHYGRNGCGVPSLGYQRQNLLWGIAHVYIIAQYILKYFSACLPIYLSVFVYQKIWSFIWNVKTIFDQI